MFRGKVVVRNLPLDLEGQIEVEAETKERLEDATEAALNAFVRMKARYISRGTHREPETPETPLEDVRRLTPPQTPPTAGGVTPPQDVKAGEPTRSLSYEGAKTIADFVYIALKDLGGLYGTNKGYSNKEILNHLVLTGGGEVVQGTKRPIGAVGQAVRNDDRFVREEGDTMLTEWIVQPETSSELVHVSESSGFEF